MGSATPIQWWRRAVFYQIYLRSFQDSNGDGVGDLPGVIPRLEYLEWLGVDCLWLSPVTVSPNADWGYDVADYCRVQPEYGSLEDLDRLIGDAGQRGIRVLLDLVPNHTSDRHPWFVDSRSSRESRHRDWYVWADSGPAGGPPNNWLSAFGGPAWMLDRETGQWYLHNFLPEQPDLNWWNERVRVAFDDIIRFWLNRGVAGFRIDVAHMIVKDAELRDNPPASGDDHPLVRAHGQRSVFNANQPELHRVLRHWRSLADGYTPERMLLGETWVLDLPTLAGFYGSGDDELHLGFNIPFLQAPFEAAALRGIVEGTEAALPAGAWPVWAASNHDTSRLATRWAANDPARVRLALLLLLTLRGTPVLYQGDEVGLVDTDLAYDQLRDPVGRRSWPDNAGRDPARTPMRWHQGPHDGFTSTGVAPWLPLADTATGDGVEEQRRVPASILHLVHDLIALRRSVPDLATGSYAAVTAGIPDGAWAFRRGATAVVVLNLTPGPLQVDMPAGGWLMAVSTARPGASQAPATLDLAPWEGVLATTTETPRPGGRSPGFVPPSPG